MKIDPRVMEEYARLKNLQQQLHEHLKEIDEHLRIAEEGIIELLQGGATTDHFALQKEFRIQKLSLRSDLDVLEMLYSDPQHGKNFVIHAPDYQKLSRFATNLDKKNKTIIQAFPALLGYVSIEERWTLERK